MRRWVSVLILLLPLAALMPFALLQRDAPRPDDRAAARIAAWDRIAQRQPVSDPATWDAVYEDAYYIHKAGRHEEALYRLLPIAVDGHPPAQTLVGLMLEAGEGVPKDICHALSWYDKAARAGHPEAQYILGEHYMTPFATRVDFGLAYYWIMTAVNNGFEGADVQLRRFDRLREFDTTGTFAARFDEAMVGEVRPEDMPPAEVFAFQADGFSNSAIEYNLMMTYELRGC